VRGGERPCHCGLRRGPSRERPSRGPNNSARAAEPPTSACLRLSPFYNLAAAARPASFRCVPVLPGRFAAPEPPPRRSDRAKPRRAPGRREGERVAGVWRLPPTPEGGPLLGFSRRAAPRTSVDARAFRRHSVTPAAPVRRRVLARKSPRTS
jgi:hypothetical protein